MCCEGDIVKEEGIWGRHIFGEAQGEGQYHREKCFSRGEMKKGLPSAEWDCCQRC